MIWDGLNISLSRGAHLVAMRTMGDPTTFIYESLSISTYRDFRAGPVLVLVDGVVCRSQRFSASHVLRCEMNRTT